MEKLCLLLLCDIITSNLDNRFTATVRFFKIPQQPVHRLNHSPLKYKAYRLHIVSGSPIGDITFVDKKIIAYKQEAANGNVNITESSIETDNIFEL